MKAEEIKNLIQDKEMLQNNLLCMPEAEDIQKALALQKKELKEIVEQNRDQRIQIQELLTNVSCKQEELSAAQAKLMQVQEQEQQCKNKMSSQKVLQILNAKMNEEASETDQLRKLVSKGEMDVKAFLKEYIGKRVKYHQHDILKNKIQQKP